MSRQTDFKKGLICNAERQIFFVKHKMNKDATPKGTYIKSASSLFEELYKGIFSSAKDNSNKIKFLNQLTKTFIDFFRCRFILLWIKDSNGVLCCQATDSGRFNVGCNSFPFLSEANMPCGDMEKMGRFCLEILRDEVTHPPFFFEKSVNIVEKEIVNSQVRANGERYSPSPGGKVPQSLRPSLLIPIFDGTDQMGLIFVKEPDSTRIRSNELNQIVDIGWMAGLAITQQKAKADLVERMKELDCLYGLSKIVATPRISLADILRQSVELLPAALQYPERASAQIRLYGNDYVTARFEPGPLNQRAELIIEGEPVGMVEAVYPHGVPEQSGDIFLQEEKKLIDTFAKQLAIAIERRRAEERRIQCQEMFLHADRLSTIGQLSAGIAHEINEPLNSILGFSQLIQKTGELSGQNRRDMDKIISAVLAARQIIAPLCGFARQGTPGKTYFNINELIKQGLEMLTTRCRNNGIVTKRDWGKDMPRVYADPAQITQILFNLVINALQSMPDGGTLTVKTDSDKEAVSLIVEDTGVGMSDKVKKQVFEPFFTTKSINQGTGLGLPIVREIVKEHGGSIFVTSKTASGSRFEIKLPLAQGSGHA